MVARDRIDNFDRIKIGRTQSARRAVTMEGHCQLADTRIFSLELKIN